MQFPLLRPPASAVAALLAAAVMAIGGTACSRVIAGGADVGAAQEGVVFDGKPLPLEAAPHCVSLGPVLMIVATEQDSDRQIAASVEPPEVKNVSVRDGDSRESYFWETTSMVGESMTFKRHGAAVTISGRVHQITNADNKKSIQITATDCPDT